MRTDESSERTRLGDDRRGRRLRRHARRSRRAQKYFTQESGLLSGLSIDTDEFPPISVGRQHVKAVDDVSFEIRRGETLGLVGESGCGKSTLGRTILRLLEPTEGRISFKGDDLAELDGEALRQKRSEIQMIFQDPQSSLDPRMKIGQIVEEPMRAHDTTAANSGRRCSEKVGLDPHHYNRHPHAFSGPAPAGQPRPCAVGQPRLYRL